MAWILGLVSLGLLVWFGYKVFSADGPEKLVISGDDHGHSGGGGSDDGHNSSDSNDHSSESGADSSASGKSASASIGNSASGRMSAVADTAGTAGATATSRQGKQPGPNGSPDPIVYEMSSEDADSVREMNKILNLRESNGSRLGIDKSQFSILWQGSSDGIDTSTLSSVRSRPYSMLN